MLIRVEGKYTQRTDTDAGFPITRQVLTQIHVTVTLNAADAALIRRHPEATKTRLGSNLEWTLAGNHLTVVWAPRRQYFVECNTCDFIH